MNGVAYKFSAPHGAAPAGMYTADLDGVRASWVVRPDGTATGVQFNGGITGRDFEQADLQQLNERSSATGPQQAASCSRPRSCIWARLRSTINGRPVVASLVTGNTRFG